MVFSHGAGVSSLAVLADGRLASGGVDGMIKLWPNLRGSLAVYRFDKGALP